MSTPDVAERFSKATAYSTHDLLQRQTAARLKTLAVLSGRLLDVGAGPGTCFDNGVVGPVTSIDIALGMCLRLKQRFPTVAAVCGDATAMPFAAAQFDSLYSNLALQWCQPFKAAVAEAARVLAPGGLGAFAMVCGGSLPELKQLGFSVNQFDSAKNMLADFDEHEWQHIAHHCETVTLYFDELRSLIYSIKGVGASARQRPAASASLRGRQDWLARLAAAEAGRTAEGLPLSYQILYVVATRK